MGSWGLFPNSMGVMGTLGSSGGGSPTITATADGGGGGSASSPESNPYGHLLASELLLERLERRRSEKQSDDGKNSASAPNRQHDPDRAALSDIFGRASPLDLGSGKTLNNLLHQIQLRRELNFPNETVPLRKEILAAVNVVPARDTRSPALLKNEGKLNWPESLRGAEFQTHRELLDAILPKATQEAGRGRVNMDQLKEIQEAVGKIEEELARQKAEEQKASEIRKLPTTEYIKTKRFVAQLGEAVRVLGQPEAKNYFNGKYAARGETVTELVDHMTREGLRFAPALPGDEAGYEALHRAFVAYFAAVQAAQQSDN
jgi:hypothetical protein